MNARTIALLIIGLILVSALAHATGTDDPAYHEQHVNDVCAYAYC